MPQSACPATPFWVSHALKFNLECLPATNVFKPKEHRNKNQMRNCRGHGDTLPLETEIVWFWRFSSLPGNHHPNTCPAVSSLSPLSCLLHPPPISFHILPILLQSPVRCCTVLWCGTAVTHTSCHQIWVCLRLVRFSLFSLNGSAAPPCCGTVQVGGSCESFVGGVPATEGTERGPH